MQTAKKGRLLWTLLLVLAMVLPGLVVAPPAAAELAPANDDFDAAQVIDGLPYTDSRDTTNASIAGDDPLVRCFYSSPYTGSATIWYRYTPATDGAITVSTADSNYNTLLAVWTGIRGSLMIQACNDNYGGEQSEVRLPVLAGTTYYIEAVSRSGAGGQLNLSVTDGAANAAPYAPSAPNPTDGQSGVPFSTDLSWAGGPYDPSAPDLNFDPDPGSLVTFNVHLGTTEGGPTTVANGCSGVPSAYTNASCSPEGLTAGTTYYWQVAATDSFGTSTVGPVWRFTTGGPAPANDDFAGALVVGALPYTDSRDIVNATTAADDPYLPCIIGPDSYRTGAHTVWYQYTPSANGTIAVAAAGDSYVTLLAVWTGTRGSLAAQACTRQTTEGAQAEVSLPVVAGTTYYIEAGDEGGPTDRIHLSIAGGMLDATPPVISAVVTGTLGLNGWYTGDVTANWVVVDPESAIIASDGCEGGTVSADTTGVTFTCTATSSGGAASQSVTIKRDATPPSLVPAVSPNPVFLGVLASTSPNATDQVSAVALAVCDSVDTSSVGARSVSCVATDNAGNTATATVAYRVIFNFSGFLPPVDAQPLFNQVKAGATVPVKFSLSGDQGLAVFARGFPRLSTTTCPVATANDGAKEKATAATGQLEYDPLTHLYMFNWRTDKTWTGCRQLELKFVDGESYSINFTFVK